MDCPRLLFSRHAFERMFSRGITPEQVRSIIAFGETIAEYRDDTPYPSRLLLGFADNTPVHVVLAKSPDTGDCHVVTVYRPDPTRWSADFKSRRTP